MSLTCVCAARFRAVCCACEGDWRALSAVWGGRAPRRKSPSNRRPVWGFPGQRHTSDVTLWQLGVPVAVRTLFSSSGAAEVRDSMGGSAPIDEGYA